MPQFPPADLMIGVIHGSLTSEYCVAAVFIGTGIVCLVQGIPLVMVCRCITMSPGTPVVVLT